MCLKSLLKDYKISIGYTQAIRTCFRAFSGVGSVAAVAAMAATLYRPKKKADVVQQRTRNSLQ